MLVGAVDAAAAEAAAGALAGAVAAAAAEVGEENVLLLGTTDFSHEGPAYGGPPEPPASVTLSISLCHRATCISLPALNQLKNGRDKLCIIIKRFDSPNCDVPV